MQLGLKAFGVVRLLFSWSFGVRSLLLVFFSSFSPVSDAHIKFMFTFVAFPKC